MPTEVPIPSPALTNPNSCRGALQPNPNFIPLLACYDLTRTSPLPASDGCPNSTSGEYAFYGHADIKEFALYIQDAITLRNWTFNLGVCVSISTMALPTPLRENRASGWLTI